MIRRAATLLALGALAACSSGEETQPPNGDPIECALGKGAKFTPVCIYDYRAAENQIVVWHPDGGFRRFGVLPGGAGVTSADGAEDVIQGLMGGKLEVTVGDDRYLLPTKPVG